MNVDLEQSAKVKSGMSLTPAERLIRYNDVMAARAKKQSLRAIAADLGVSAERVRQIIAEGPDGGGAVGRPRKATG
jgi:DNA-directed RNA polymerase sigma subunit (sigma70/sigma32)